MIASTSSGRVFAGLGRYLARGRRGSEEDRVAWAEARHLPTRDPEIAARYMQASALTNSRVEKAVYHVALSFDPNDPVTPAVMRQAANRLIRDLGLEEHQAIFVAHQDRAHPHVHLMINRVHPETGRVWDRSYDYRRIETSLRAQEVELGVRVVAGRHAPIPTRDVDQLVEVHKERPREGITGPSPNPTPRSADGPPSGPSSARAVSRGVRPAELDDVDRQDRTKGEVRQEIRTAEAVLIGRARARVNDIRASTGWDELERRLASHGLRIERKGQGLVLTDGMTTVKASRVARDSSLAQLELRFRVAYDQWIAGRTRVIAAPTPGALMDVLNTAQSDRQYDTSRVMTGPGRTQDSRGAVGSGVPNAPGAAIPFSQEDRPMATTVPPLAPTDTPESQRRRIDFAEMSRVGRAAEYVDRALADTHRVNPELAKPLHEQSPRVQFVATRLEQYEKVLQAGVMRTGAKEAQAHARDLVADGTRAVKIAAAAEKTFADTLKDVFKDPTAVRKEIATAAASVGAGKAMAMLRDTPEVYGKLKENTIEERVGLLHRNVRFVDTDARTHAAYASELGTRALRSAEQAPSGERLAAMVQTMDRAQAQVVRAEKELAALAPGDALARSVARGVARLNDQEFGQLKSVVSIERAEMATTMRGATVQALAVQSVGRIQRLHEALTDRPGADLSSASRATPVQQSRAAGMHEHAARALENGRDVSQALAGAVLNAPTVGDAAARGANAPSIAAGPKVDRPVSGPAAGPTRDVGLGVVGTGLGTGAGKDGGVTAARADVDAATPSTAGERAATPRERGAAADLAARSVHQAVQALTPDELQALVTGARVVAQLAAGLAAGAAKDLTSVSHVVRSGVATAIAGREVER